MPPGLNIAALAQRTGVAPDTLRKWESRYGVLRPSRTEGGQRRYDETDVARVEWLRERIAEGWRIGAAAELLRGSDRTPSLGTGDLVAALKAAVSGPNPSHVGDLLDQALAVLPLTAVLEDVIGPLMEWVGDAWHDGEVSEAQEHAVTSRVRARLLARLATEQRGTRGRAVLACAPGEQHDIGLLMLALTMRADGWAIEYLGPDTPVARALEHARLIDADACCWSASLAATADTLWNALATEPQTGRPQVFVGGSAVTTRRTRGGPGRRATVLPADLPGSVAALRAAAHT